MSHRFVAESKRLLDLDGDSCKLTTIQALLVLGSEAGRSGLDKLGWLYIVRAATMAKQMSLMSPSQDNRKDNLEKVKYITAWSTFTWTWSVSGSLSADQSSD